MSKPFVPAVPAVLSEPRSPSPGEGVLGRSGRGGQGERAGERGDGINSSQGVRVPTIITGTVLWTPGADHPLDLAASATHGDTAPVLEFPALVPIDLTESHGINHVRRHTGVLANRRAGSSTTGVRKEP